MKKIKIIFLTIICLLSTLYPVYAIEDFQQYIDDPTSYFISYYDNETLKSLAVSFENQYQAHVYIVTTNERDAQFDLNRYTSEKYQNLYHEEDGIAFGIRQNFKNGKIEMEYVICSFGKIKDYLDPQLDVYQLFQDNDEIYAIQTILYQIRNQIDQIQPKQVIDMSQLLTKEQIIYFSDKLEKLKENYQCDIVIVSTSSLNKKSSTHFSTDKGDFADNYFDENGYGVGENCDGILLLLDTHYHEWYISTSGKAINSFTDWGIDYIGEQMYESLDNQDYNQSLEVFLNHVDLFLEQSETDRPFDTDYHPGLEVLDQDVEEVAEIEEKEDLSLTVSQRVLIATFFGFIIALITGIVKLGKINSKHKVTHAHEYVKDQSFQLTNSKDIFLYTTITRSAKTKSQKTNSVSHQSKSKSSSKKTNSRISKGSTTHQSSSKRTHGGKGGHF